MIGEKTTFPPSWLINGCLRRGWLYITPSYRLLPEVRGLDVVADALDSATWVARNLAERLIVAGSSAGGYLALFVATQLTTPSPLAFLSIYGMLDLTDSRYIEPGTTLMGLPPLSDTSTILREMSAAKDNKALDSYPFPENPSSDKRMLWIATSHQEALYPDLLTDRSGLSASIRQSGIGAIPAEHHKLFPAAFGLRKGFPPAAFLHGDKDDAVGVNQSVQLAEVLDGLGVKVMCEIVTEKGHGFDVMEIAAEVDVEKKTATEEPVYRSVRKILQFLGNELN